MKTRLLLLGALALAVASTSCSSGPAPPKAGSPAFYWTAAQSAYHAGDFIKANENLVQLLASDNEYTARARPWAVALAAGLADGYGQMAEAYESGARMNRANPTPFHKQVSALRSLASAAALEFADNAHKFMAADQSPNVTLSFEFPTGNAAEPANLKKISSGMVMQDSEQEALLRAMLQRGVLLSVCDALGSPDDSAQALEKLKAGEAQVPREKFLYAVAKALYEQSQLYGTTKLDQPNRLQLFCEEAAEALKSAPASKDAKALDTKIQAALKKLKKG